MLYLYSDPVAEAEKLKDAYQQANEIADPTERVLAKMDIVNKERRFLCQLMLDTTSPRTKP